MVWREEATVVLMDEGLGDNPCGIPYLGLCNVGFLVSWGQLDVRE